jgi:diazepam-binding inhibitor (GABA receptor modulator, acyl-CoA-binding protein)
MELQKIFEEAVAKSKSLPAQSNDTLLELYSLYKQATEGDNTGDEPTNPFDFVGKAKFAAWDGLKGLSKEEAIQKYVDLVKSLGA